MARPTWTLREAEERCGVSRSTLKRRLAADDFPNAYKTSQGQWRIPVNDLIGAGYQPGAVDWDEEPEEPAPAATPPDRVTELEHELAQERLRRASAEQLAQERQDRIADLQQAMRLLEPPRSTAGSPGPTPWVSDLGQPAQMTHPDLGHDRSPQVRHGSDEPPSRSTDLGQDEPPEPPRRGWWRRITGR